MDIIPKGVGLLFEFKEKNGVKFLTVGEFEATGLVRHCFSTRIGGVSVGEAASMNFGLSAEDSVDNVFENFKIICKTIGTDFESIVFADQVHKTNVRVVTDVDKGKGLLKKSDIKETDALVTDCPGVTLVTFHADCIPVFFLDVRKKAIGLAHSGWKGTYENISENVVKKMKETYQTDPSDLICAVGPSIRACHFEVGEPVADIFEKRYGKKYIKEYGKPHVDLASIVKSQLEKCGVGKVVMSDICTYCRNDIFYSYRGDNRKTGRLIAMMSLKEEV